MTLSLTAAATGNHGKRPGFPTEIEIATSEIGVALRLSSIGDLRRMGAPCANRVWLAAGAAATSLVLSGCNPSAPEKASPNPVSQAAATVAVATAERSDLPQTVVATGTVAAWQELIIGAQTSGLAVVDVRVKENDAVRAGDLLVALDDRALKARIAEENAVLSEVQANLESAKQEAARGDVLVEQKAMSVETVQTRRTAIRTSQAKLDQAAAALNQLQTELDQTVVRAPAAGIVDQAPVTLGSVVQVGSELVRLIRDGRIEVQTKVPERDLALIRGGESATVIGADGARVEGHVRDVSAKIDSGTRLGVAFVSLPTGSPLRPGGFARVSINVGRREVLTIPEQALVWVDGKAAAFVVRSDNIVVQAPLSTGARDKGRVAVESGLNEGDRVVVSGAGFLRDGDRVRIEAAIDEDTHRMSMR